MAKNLSIVAEGISGKEGKLLGYNISDNGIYTPAIGDVARDTTATYVAQDGTIKTAQENVARVDYTNGVAELLLEPASKNLITYSEDFSQSYWTSSGVIVEGGYIAPDGSNNAYKVSGTIGVSYLKTLNGLFTGNTSKSIYVKSTSVDGVIGLLVPYSTEQFEVKNEWQRIEGVSGQTDFYAVDFRGSETTLSEVLIWGAQVEALPYPTSYIPNFGNSAGQTRGADSLTNFGSSPIIDSESGILFFEGSALSVSGTTRGVGLNNSDNSKRIYFIFDSSGRIKTYALDSGSQSSVLTTNKDILTNKKIVIKYNNSILELYLDGVLVGNDSWDGFSKDDLIRMSFNDGILSDPFYGRVRQVKHLPYNTDITTL